MRTFLLALVMMVSLGAQAQQYASATTVPTPAEEQGGTLVTGTLVDSTGKPVVNAYITLVGRTTVRTDARGAFEFRNVPAGTYAVRVSLPEGGALELDAITVADGQKELTVGALQIAAKEYQLGTVTVEAFGRSWHGIGRLPDMEATELYAGKKSEVLVMDALEVNAVQNVSRQVFAKVPGIMVWENDGSGAQINIAARGLSPNRSWEFNTRQNGHDIASDPFGYPEAYYNPAMETVERVEIVRGAGALQYGSQFGGMVNYILRKAPEDKPFSILSRQTGGSYGLFSSYNLLGGRSGKLTYTGMAHYRQADGWRQNSRYNVLNTFAAVGYDLRPNTQIGAEFTYSELHSQQPGGLTDSLFRDNAQQSFRSRNWFRIRWMMPSVYVKSQLTDSLSLSVRGFAILGQRQSIGNVAAINVLADNPAAIRRADRDDYTNFGLEGRLGYNYMLGAVQSKAILGLRYYNGETKRQRGNGTAGAEEDYSIQVPEAAMPLNLTFTTESYSAYIENAFRLGQVTVTPGIRYEHIRNTGAGTLSGAVPTSQGLQNRSVVLAGVALSYKPLQSLEVYGNFTQAYRPFLFSDLYPASPTDSVAPNSLKDVNGYNTDLGVRGRIEGWFSYDVSFFYLEYKDRLGTLLVNGKNLKTNLGASRGQGVESYVEINPFKALDVDLGGVEISLYNTTAYVDARYTEGAAKDKRVEYAPRWTVRSGLSVRYAGFRTSLAHSYTDKVYTDAANTENPSANAQVGAVTAYQVLDWNFSWNVRQWFELSGGVNNIADLRYATRRAGGYPGPGLMPAEPRTFYLGAGIRF